MATNDQPIDIPLGAGVDTKTDEKLVGPGKLLLLENGYQQQTGSIRKRNGYSELGTGAYPIDDRGTLGEIEAGSSLHELDGRLVLVGDSRKNQYFDRANGPGVFTYAEDENRWVTSGSYFPCTFTVDPITTSHLEHENPSVAEGDDKRIYVYEGDDDDCYYDLIDKKSGAYYATGVEFQNDAQNPKAVYLEDGYGKFFLTLAGSTIATNVSGVVIDSSDPDRVAGGGSQTSWYLTDEGFSDSDGTTWDVDKVEYDGYDYGVGVYKDVNGYIHFKAFDSQGNIFYAEEIVEAVGNCLSVHVIDHTDIPNRTELIYIVWTDTSNRIKMKALDTVFNTVVGVTTIDSGTTRTYGNITLCKERQSVITFFGAVTEPEAHTRIIAEVRQDTSDTITREQNYYLRTFTIDYDGSGALGATSLNNMALASKAWSYNDHAYFVAHYPSGTQSTYFLMSLKHIASAKPSVVAKVFYGSGGTVRRQNGLSQVAITSNLHTVAVERATSIYNETDRLKQVWGVNFDLKPEPLQSVTLGNTGIIGGGVVSCYDRKVQELGFHLQPEIDPDAVAASSGSALLDGYHSIQFLYQWVDRNGDIHRSAPSTAVGVDISAGEYIQVDVDYLNMTDWINKGSDVDIQVYRTPANGEIYYLSVDETFNNALGFDTAETLNNYAGEGDDELIRNQIIYTTGGALPNVAPPGSNILAVSENRAFLVPMDDPTAVWFSKPKVRGVAPEFAEQLQTRIDREGPNKALAVMDDKVIVFKSDSIYYFNTSQLPNALGQGAFPIIRNIQTSVGCVDSNSVVNFGDGVLFKSRKGIYMLNRSLQVQYIGAPVEEWNKYKVLSAQLMTDRDQVRFLLEKGRGVLVYDYYHGAWGRYTNHAAADAAVWDNKYCYLKSDGVVRQEDESFVDVNFEIPLKVRTPWIKLGSIQGFQRVKRAMILGNFKSAHTLTVKVYINYDDNTVVQTRTFATSDRHTAGEPLQFEIHLKRQKCQSIMFEVFDGDTSQTHESLTLEGVSLWVGVKQGLNKLPDRKTR